MTFEDDKIGRKKYADFLTEMISNSEKYKRKSDSDSFNIAIDSGWGTGKTTFIDMWINELEKQKDAHGNTLFNIINFNAWKYDFSKNAFSSIIYSIFNSKLIDELKNQEEEKNVIKKLLTYSSKLIMTVAKVGLRVKTESEYEDIVGDAFDEISENGIKGIKELIDPDNPLNKKIISFYKDFEVYYQAIEEIKKALQYLVKDKPLLIIIDELDRCKPLYAIELLESIKHIFDVKNLIFVFALDMDQLSHSIKCVYGEGMDACGYLCRFFDYITKMPIPDLQKYFMYVIEEKKLINSNLSTYSIDSKYNNENILNLFVDISVNMRLSLREVNTIYCNYLLLEKIELQDINSMEAYLLYWFLLILKYKYIDEYNNIFLKNDVSFTKHTFINDMIKEKYTFIQEALEQITSNQKIENLEYRLFNWIDNNPRIKISKFERTDGGIVYSKIENHISQQKHAYSFHTNSNLSFCLFQNDLKKWDKIKSKYINSYIEEKLECFDFSFESQKQSGNVVEEIKQQK